MFSFHTQRHRLGGCNGTWCHTFLAFSWLAAANAAENADIMLWKLCASFGC